MTRGDLILMSATPNPISALIQKYDRSPYTHIGIDVGDGSVLNCRLDPALLWKREWGGVQCEDMATIEDRALFRAPVDAPAAVKEAAVERAKAWSEEGGVGDLSSFSFPKMFQCAVAVAASRPDRDSGLSDRGRASMLDAACDAADEWAYEPGGPASFFCAEMVVVAYGWEVPRSLLPPPASAADVLRGDGEEPGWIAKHLERMWQKGRRGVTMARVVAAAVAYDPTFTHDSYQALLDSIGTSGHPDAPVERDRGNDPLPPALVTPRMLLGCDWVVADELAEVR